MENRKYDELFANCIVNEQPLVLILTDEMANDIKFDIEQRKDHENDGPSSWTILGYYHPNEGERQQGSYTHKIYAISQNQAIYITRRCLDRLNLSGIFSVYDNRVTINTRGTKGMNLISVPEHIETTLQDLVVSAYTK